jgi:hypothetical protein
MAPYRLYSIISCASWNTLIKFGSAYCDTSAPPAFANATISRYSCSVSMFTSRFTFSRLTCNQPSHRIGWRRLPTPYRRRQETDRQTDRPRQRDSGRQTGRQAGGQQVATESAREHQCPSVW